MQNILDQQIKNAQRIPNMINAKKTHLGTWMIITTENPNKGARGAKGYISHHGTKKWITFSVFSELMEAR